MSLIHALYKLENNVYCVVHQWCSRSHCAAFWVGVQIKKTKSLVFPAYKKFTKTLESMDLDFFWLDTNRKPSTMGFNFGFLLAFRQLRHWHTTQKLWVENLQFINSAPYSSTTEVTLTLFFFIFWTRTSLDLLTFYFGNASFLTAFLTTLLLFLCLIFPSVILSFLVLIFPLLISQKKYQFTR